MSEETSAVRPEPVAVNVEPNLCERTPVDAKSGSSRISRRRARLEKKLNQTPRCVVDQRMKRSRVIVPWPEGLHLRPAAKLVRVAQKFRSTVFLKCGDRIADVRSIVNLLALCATLGVSLDLEVVGDDEQDAVVAVEQVFTAADAGADSPGGASAQSG